MDRYNMIENAKDLLEIIDHDQYPDLCFYLTSGSSNNGRRQNPFSSSHRHRKPLSPVFSTVKGVFCAEKF